MSYSLEMHAKLAQELEVIKKYFNSPAYNKIIDRAIYDTQQSKEPFLNLYKELGTISDKGVQRTGSMFSVPNPLSLALKQLIKDKDYVKASETLATIQVSLADLSKNGR